ncbi:sigma-E factor negative regulatory protein [Rhodocyclaceae bacterium SMB388]
MKDQLSALLDGDLDDSSSGAVFDSLRRDPAMRERWSAYCLIGDTIRGESAGSVDLSARVMEQIRTEPTLLAPAAIERQAGERGGRKSSLMSIAASVMGVVAVGWVAMSLYPKVDSGVGTVAASARLQAVEPVGLQTSVPAGVDQSDPHRKYLFVHQAMNGGGPIPGALQYVRTVSADIAGDIRR